VRKVEQKYGYAPFEIIAAAGAAVLSNETGNYIAITLACDIRGAKSDADPVLLAANSAMPAKRAPPFRPVPHQARII